MHICPFVRFPSAICKTLFYYGMYNQNCVRSIVPAIVPASDVKGVWHLRNHSHLSWHNLSLIAKNFQRILQFYLVGIQKHVCPKFGLIYEHKVGYERAVQEICEQESCAMSLVSTETLLVVPSCLIWHVLPLFKI